MNVEEYKSWYQEHYGKKPSDKLIESYCKANGIPWPGDRQDEEIYCPPPKCEMLFGKEMEG